MADPLILLHGFAQSGAVWDAVRELLGDREVRAPDLRGHGSAADARPIDTESLVGDVLAAAPPRFALAGYSMGGRLALHVALHAPTRVTRLTLVSTTAGIDDPGEAEQRRNDDEALAAEIERHEIASFARRWGALPLWRGQPAAVRERADALRLAQDPAGLAASLRGFGTGAMAPVWGRLRHLGMAVTIMAGSEDEKYRAIARRLRNHIPGSRTTIVAGAGHALPLEAPGAVARAL